MKLNPVRSILEGKRVVLIDDSIVRGTTSRKIVQDGARRRARAKCTCASAARRPISPCFYGVDTPRRSELIAATHTLEEIRTLPRRRHARVPEPRRPAGRGDAEQRTLLHVVLHRHYPVEFPRDKTPYLQLALKLDKPGLVLESRST